jgi:hypothetical protein
MFRTARAGELPHREQVRSYVRQYVRTSCPSSTNCEKPAARRGSDPMSSAWPSWARGATALVMAWSVAACGLFGKGTEDGQPVPPVDFAGYSPVSPEGFHTFHNYGWSGVQFRTGSGVRCRILWGAKSWQYTAGVDCWGELPGVAPGVNLAQIDPIAPFDKDNPDAGPSAGSTTNPPVDRRVYAVLRHADLGPKEIYFDGSHHLPVDPSSYHLLSPGQKIVIPGARTAGQDFNNAVCAVGNGELIACEVSKIEIDDGKAHGFVLSPRGSRVY